MSLRAAAVMLATMVVSVVSSGPSTITRSLASVPLQRTSTRPRLPSDRSAFNISWLSLGMSDRGFRAASSTLSSTCGSRVITRESSLSGGIEAGDRAYFVHSYAAPVTADCLFSSDHGESFAAVVQRGHVAGAQFHPERSAKTGARLLQNFLEGGLA